MIKKSLIKTKMVVKVINWISKDSIFGDISLSQSFCFLESTTKELIVT